MDSPTCHKQVQVQGRHVSSQPEQQALTLFAPLIQPEEDSLSVCHLIQVTAQPSFTGVDREMEELSHGKRCTVIHPLQSNGM